MRDSQGWSALEFAVALTIVLVLTASLLDRLAVIQNESERIEVSETIRHLELALQIEWQRDPVHARALVDGDLLVLLARNPVAFSHRWQYNPKNRTLSYRPRRAAVFEERRHLQWRVIDIVDSEGHTRALRIDPIDRNAYLRSSSGGDKQLHNAHTLKEKVYAK